ncbi:PadR family transcriptional regulator [Streptomyces mirabilis]
MRLAILHHAAEEEIHGAWMTEELARHGYQISPGTLYPMLHRLEACSPHAAAGVTAQTEKKRSDERGRWLLLHSDPPPARCGALVGASRASRSVCSAAL